MKKLMSCLLLFSLVTSIGLAQTPATTPAKPKTEVAKSNAPFASETKQSTATVKKDGTVDLRFKQNKHLKKDGMPDKRFKEHKTKPTTNPK